MLALGARIVYNKRCCDMIAVKREVAVRETGFPWSECQVNKLTTSHCTSSDAIVRDGVCVSKDMDTHGDVYSRRLSYCLEEYE